MAAPIMPAVANGRAPKRSDRNPEVGPAIRNPAVSGSMKMPAQSGVCSKLKPCCGSQMPCSQMISMNINPPRATADRNVESVPNVNARIRNSCSRNMGSATRRSIIAKAIRLTVAPAISASTLGLVQPVGWPPAGRMPYVTATITSTSPSANVTLPHQSIGARRGTLRSSSLR